MSFVINPKNEGTHRLSEEEAFVFFDACVRERLGISAEEFLKRHEEFKDNPHYDSLIAIAPLAKDVSQ